MDAQLRYSAWTACGTCCQADREAKAAAAEERRAVVAEASRKLFLRSPVVHGLRSAIQLSDAFAERQVPWGKDANAVLGCSSTAFASVESHRESCEESCLGYMRNSNLQS